MRNARTRFFTLLLSVCMLASLLVMPAGAAEFSDVPDWAAKSVDRWTEAGVMEGNEDGSFDSKHTLTRAEFAIILCRLMGYTEKSDPATFTDLPKDQKAADALLKLHAAGVMLGVGSGRADPNGALTREHVAVMMFRALNMKADPAAAPMSFADADRVSDWARVEMAAMSGLKLIEGVGNNTLAPKRDIPKQDMAALLDKMIAGYVTEDGRTVDTSGATNPNGAVIIKARNVTVSGTLHVQNYTTMELGARVDVGGTGQLYLYNDSNLISGTVSVNSDQWRGARFYGATTVASTGRVQAAGTSSTWSYAVEFNGPLDNKGAITVGSGARVFASNAGFAMQSGGTIELNGALCLNGTKLVNTGGITGSGTITGALGEDTTSYDERNGLTCVEVTGRQTPDSYSRYKFTFDPDETAEVVLYRSTLVNEQGGSTASSISVNIEDFPEE